MNVFDIVNEFYTQDPEWNSILAKRVVDDYLRTLAWQGEEDETLTDVWSNILLFCVYLGNNDHFLGDMTREDFIDCVAWCGRNVADFKVDPEHITEFLGDLDNFYAYLFRKRQVLKPAPIKEALQKLVKNGKLQLLDSSGNFLSEIEKYNIYSSQDLPAKIFLNVGEKLDSLIERMRYYFSISRFRHDIERAGYLFNGMLANGVLDIDKDSEEYIQSFWDYFFFDYHLLGDDKTPVQHYYDIVCAGGRVELERSHMDILLELTKARLVLFRINGILSEGLFGCTDFFTKEGYTLSLPVDSNLDFSKMLFIGHVYYNDSMVVSFVRGFKISTTVAKRMLATLKRAKDWLAIREGGKLSWQEFTAHNAIFLHQTCMIFSTFLRLDVFNHETHVQAYRPQPLLDDEVSRLLPKLLQPYLFTACDIRLCQTMWSDFQARTHKKVRMPEIWAAGIIRNFVDINDVYNYDLPKLSAMCHNVPMSTISRTSNEILKELELEESDPRYINEEGLLLLLLT